MLACLILLTVAVYWPVHRYGFVDYDDNEYVLDNPHVRAGFSDAQIKYAFTTYKMGNWNPLLWISFYTDRWMFGIQPGGMHIENVFLHLVTGLLLWRLLFVATGELNCSFIAAAIFLIHPLHVESVAWISERKDVLSTPLLIGAMLAYMRFCQPSSVARRWIAYGLMVLLFTLSLMAKSMGVTLPAVLLLMDFWPLRRWPSRSWFELVIEKLPLIVISLASMALVHRSQALTGAMSSFRELGAADRINNAIVCYLLYVWKLFVPIKLAAFYQHPGARPIGSVVAAGGLLLLITAFFYRARKQRPYLLMGWFWFLGTLVPVIGLIQVGGQSMADRYSYFPSIGLSIVAVWGARAVLKNEMAEIVLTSAVLCIFSALTAVQVSYWRNSETLFTHAAAVTDDNPVAHNVLGGIAFNKGDIKRAVQECNLALRYADNAQAFDGLGNCWFISTNQSEREKATGYYRKAVAMDPHKPIYRVHLASALRIDGKFQKARQEAQAALALEPDFSLALKELANIDAAEKKAASK